MTLRAIVIAAVLTFVAAKWVLMSEVVMATCNVTESVPPIPVVAILLALALLVPLSKKALGRAALTHGEAMVIFAMLAAAVSVMGGGGLLATLAPMLTLFYLASPANNFAEYQKYVPVWFNPRDERTVTEFFEGSYTGVTPWMTWLPYLAVWAGFFLVLFFTMMCLLRIFYDHWSRHDRLTFPIVQMVTAIGQATVAQEGQPAFIRNPLAWLGFGLAALFNVANMIHAINPDFPATGNTYQLGGLFTERPWSAIGLFYFRYDPSLLGMGYLMSAEVLIGAIVGFFFQKALSIFAAAVGHEGSFPPFGADSSGAFLILAFFLVWSARRYLWQSFRSAFSAPGERQDVPLPPRWAVLGLIVGLVLTGVFFGACKYSLARVGVGFSLWAVAAFMFLFFAFSFVYARIRAEAGAPMVWLFPYGAHRDMLFNFIGTKRIFAAGGAANLIMLSELWFLSRGYFQSESGVLVENFRIGEVIRAGTNPMGLAGMLGLLLGIACAMYAFVNAFYNYGANNLKGGANELLFQETIQRATNPATADPGRASWILATFIGMGMATALTLARRAFFRCPVHPLGLAAGLAFGLPLWGPFLVAYLCKLVAMKTGGIRLYRRFIPLFIGMVIGHYFVGGIVWGSMGLAGNPAFPRYRVYFG